MKPQKQKARTKTAGPDKVRKLAQKLDSWAKTLPETEQALLRQLLGRCERQKIKIGEDSYTIEGNVEQAVMDALAPLAKGRRPPRAWVQGGPLWARWSSRQY
jgi:predicted nuclease with TOPRIM domain